MYRKTIGRIFENRNIVIDIIYDYLKLKLETINSYEIIDLQTILTNYTDGTIQTNTNQHLVLIYVRTPLGCTTWEG